jgi:hypothetical protein
MKKLKIIMLFGIGALSIASKSFGQANPFINVLPSNSGIVSVGATIDIVVTVGNTGPNSTVPQAKLRPIIQVPASVTFLNNAQQVGLPAGWTILSNTGSQIRLCNSADPIPVNSSRIITLKAQGVTATPPQSFSGNINFGNGTTCAAGPSVAGDLTTDNSATSTVQVVAPVTTTLNLNVFIEGYWDGISAMSAALANQGQSNPSTDCDSITVELHDANASYGPLYSTIALLHTDGTASAVFSSSVTPGNYYIVVKHRNSIETWSANPEMIGTTTNYNFSTAASMAYGNNQVQVSTGIFAIISGDVNQDYSIDAFDYLMLDPDIIAGASGYVNTDLTGDGVVDAFDYIILDANLVNGIGAVLP